MTMLQNVSGLLSCPSGHGRDGTLSRVEVQGHSHGGWEGLCCSDCAKGRVAVRAWGLKSHLGHSWGAPKEGTRLRQRGVQKQLEVCYKPTPTHYITEK